MIAQALYDYLTNPQDLTGQAATPFVRPQMVYTLQCVDRNDARRLIRDRIGQRIYRSRRPADIQAHTAITIRTVTVSRHYSLVGEQDHARTILQVDVWAKHGDAATRAQTVGELLRLSMNGWHEENWGDLFIYECQVERDGTLYVGPSDGTDDWTHQVSADYSIAHEQPAAYYPATTLTAQLTWVDDAKVGELLRLSAADTIVPEGRSMADIDWTIRIGGEAGAIATTFSGAPDDVPSISPTGGTNLSPELSRTAYGLTGEIVHVTVTVTDDLGGTSIIKGERHE